MDYLVTSAEQHLTECLYALPEWQRRRLILVLCAHRDMHAGTDPQSSAVWNALAALVAEINSYEARTLRALATPEDPAEWIE